MRKFNVYTHPIQGYEAVKIGFSWPAFFFGLFWMLVKKLWVFAGLWFSIYVICSLVETIADKTMEEGEQALVNLVLLVVYFALWLIPSFKGNEWRDKNLSKRGYTFLSTIQAETPDAAIAQLVKPS